MKGTNEKQIMIATKWSMLAEIVAKLVAPIVNIILARLLDPTAYGVVASITIITSFADIFTDAGFQKYVIQKEYKNDEKLNNDSNVAFTSNFTLSLLIFLSIVLFRKPLSKAVGCPDATNALVVASISILCTSFSSIIIARFRRNLNFRPLFYVRAASSFIPLLVTVPLAFALHSYWALVLGTVVQQLFIAIVLFCKSKYKPHFRFCFLEMKQMISFSLWNLLETLSIWFTGQASVFIVANVLNVYYLGLYRTGMATINSYMAIFTSAIAPVLFSALSRNQNDEDKFKNTVCIFQKMLALFIIPMGAGVFLYRNFVVKILLGSQWLEIANFMGLWAVISSITIVISNVACEIYRSKGLPKISFFLQISYLIFYIPAIYFSARVDFKTLCLVSCFIRLLPVVLDIVVLNLVFKIDTITVVSNVWYYVIATAIMSICGIIMQRYSQNTGWNIISIIICIIVYFLFVLINPKTRKHMVELKKIKG